MGDLTTRAMTIEGKIYLVRGQKVMLDVDLAILYGVKVKQLNLAVKRNIIRFPGDFMFTLTPEEDNSLRFQNETSKPKGRGGSRYLPHAFTEQGIAMLSSVLRSDQAVLVNIQIMRAFVKIRELLLTHKDLAEKLEALEKKYDRQFRIVFDAIREIMSERSVPRKQIVGLARKD